LAHKTGVYTRNRRLYLAMACADMCQIRQESERERTHTCAYYIRRTLWRLVFLGDALTL
jgi:hypothetical protein